MTGAAPLRLVEPEAPRRLNDDAGCDDRWRVAGDRALYDALDRVVRCFVPFRERPDGSREPIGKWSAAAGLLAAPHRSDSSTTVSAGLYPIVVAVNIIIFDRRKPRREVNVEMSELAKRVRLTAKHYLEAKRAYADAGREIERSYLPEGAPSFVDGFDEFLLRCVESDASSHKMTPVLFTGQKVLWAIDRQNHKNMMLSRKRIPIEFGVKGLIVALVEGGLDLAGAPMKPAAIAKALETAFGHLRDK